MSSARNTGVEALEHDVDAVVFFDSDDLLTRNAVATLRETLLKHPSAPAAYGMCHFVDADDRRLPDEDGEFQSLRRFRIDGRNVRLCTRDEATTFEALALHNWIYTPGQALIRRSALGRLRFDTALPAAEDWGFWLELSREHGLVLVPTHVIDYRRHGSNTSSDSGRMRNARALLDERFSANPSLTERERAILAEARVRKWWFGSMQSVRMGEPKSQKGRPHRKPQTGESRRQGSTALSLVPLAGPDRVMHRQRNGTASMFCAH